jgi:hypothetical protein
MSGDGKSDIRKEIHDEWNKRTADWERMAAASGIKLPPGAKIDPKDIRVEVGPPMTEAQFKAWQERHKKFAKKFSQ